LYQITVKLTNNGPGSFDPQTNITFYTSGQKVTPRITTVTGNITIKVGAGGGLGSTSWGKGSTGLLTYGFETAYPTSLTYNDGQSTKTVQL